MYSYLIVFFLIYIFSFAEYKYEEKKLLPYVLIPLILLFAFVSFRYNVGGDWKAYFNNFNEQKDNLLKFNYFEAKNFFITIISWYFSNFFDSIVFQNVFLSIIFFSSFFLFIQKNVKHKISSIIILFPIGVLLLLMGYQRQALALSFLFLTITSFSYGYRLFFSVFFILGFLSHFSFIVFTPLLILLTFNNLLLKFNIAIYNILSSFKVKVFLILFFLLLLLINLIFYNFQIFDTKYISNLLSNDFLPYFIYYLPDKIQSRGSTIRIVLSLLSLFILLIFYEKLINKKNENILFLFYILFFVFLLFSNIFLFTTISDRFGFYTIPFQIIVITRCIYLYEKKYYFVKHLLLLPYVIYLFIWLQFSIYSRDDWYPYTTFLDFK